MKYVHYADYQVLGFYDPEIHASIPEPNFAISDDVWQAYLTDQAAYKVMADQLVYAPVIPPEPTPDEILTEKLAALDAEYDSQRKELWNYLNLAVNYWQDTSAADSIRAELTALEGEYNAKAEAIWNERNASLGGNETVP